ncbi:BTAD domain-containing putative transcriptional regulator [Amycolatopsis sp. cmx-4-54]|uniref:AfsR/SARP family transcriptional regulator n=1 Tax=Amycolatopsis sp. cmx-4-54 TaxID=2790936 RepID=UPI00397DFB5D
MTIEIRLLGKVETLVDGSPVSLGGPTRQAVLAALAMRAPEVVQPDELISLVWGDAAPSSAAGNMQTYLSGLRRALEPNRPRDQPPGLLVRTGGGYQLRLPPGTVDIQEFSRLADEGYQAAADGRLDDAAISLHTALSKWRGEPLAGVQGPFAQAQRNSCIEHRLNVLESWARVLLELGRPAEVVATLREPAAANPMRERLAACFIRALHECGQDHEALTHYELVERELRERFGMAPSADLSSLLAEITGGQKTAPAGDLAPKHLPPDVRSFTGRQAELARMHEFARAPAGSPRLMVLHGAGGSGKTALAVRFGNEVAGLFPDGRFYVDLRGFAPGGEPLSTGAAAGALLRAIGARADRIPAHDGARVAYLRTLLAGQRALIVLDNAQDAEQVRPLLPGTDGCLTIVTSRRRLRGLAVSEGALRLPVDMLAESEAVALLAGIIGHPRVAAEPAAAADLARLCGLMPLPLRIVAERAAMRSRRDLAELVTELTEAHRRLDVLSVGEDSTSLRAVFSWSYAALAPEHARVFRLLGGFPGPDVSAPMAAAMAGCAAPDAESAIRALQEAHLLEVRAAGYYRLHDLIRAYALERFELDEPEEAKKSAQRRLVGWYLHGAQAADTLLSPQPRAPGPPMEPLPEAVTPPEFTYQRMATEWCEAELPNMLAVIELAASAGFRRHAWLIPNFLIGFFIRRCHFPEWIHTMTIAIEQCRALGDPNAEVRCRYNRLIAYNQVSQFDRTLAEAFELLASDEINTEPGVRPYVRNAIGNALLGTDHPAEAAEQLEKALTGEHREVAKRLPGLLACLGEAYTALGRLSEARERHEQALAIREEQGDLSGQSSSLRGIGRLESRAGDNRPAVNHFIEARRLARIVGARREEALSLRALGETYLLLPGRRAEAIEALSAALDLFDHLGDAAAEDVRAQLGGLS